MAYDYWLFPSGSWTPYPPPRRAGIHFTEVELKEILISILVLTLAFYFAMFGITSLGTPFARTGILAAFLAVTTAFFVSLIAEKYTAMKYGYFVEYHYSPMGLVIAFFTSLFGFLFAFPGTSRIYGSPYLDEHAKISLSHIGANIATGLLFLGIAITSARNGLFQGYIIGYVVSWVNLILAAFSLLPFPGLYGYSVMKYSPPVYIVLWILVAAGIGGVLFYL